MSKQPPLNAQHTYTISEYGLIGIDESVERYNGFESVKVPPKVYNELEAFAKSDYGKEVFSFSGNGRYLQAKSYVGTIQTRSGYTIEILPKIYNSANEESTKAIFLELLKMLYKLPNFKHIDKAHFEHNDMPLLEIFISMFLDEVGAILKKGIKSDYIANQDNLYYLKGKLIIAEQIKHNTIHKERFCVEYDEYTPNRVENRLIKSTLNYLLKISKSFENIRLARMYQEHIYSVEYSRNYDADFRACKTHQRGMEHYRNALIWARVFLKRDSFSSFSGDTIAFAILYPMEKLFENHMEQRLRSQYLKYQVVAQNYKRDFVKGLFGIKPDYIIKEGKTIKIVADAKWKMITSDTSFSQSDFYQLFAYQYIYKPSEPLRLYYPMSEIFTKIQCFRYFDNTKILAIPVDMNEVVSSDTK